MAPPLPVWYCANRLLQSTSKSRSGATEVPYRWLGGFDAHSPPLAVQILYIREGDGVLLYGGHGAPAIAGSPAALENATQCATVAGGDPPISGFVCPRQRAPTVPPQRRARHSPHSCRVHHPSTPAVRAARPCSAVNGAGRRRLRARVTRPSPPLPATVAAIASTYDRSAAPQRVHAGTGSARQPRLLGAAYGPAGGYCAALMVLSVVTSSRGMSQRPILPPGESPLELHPCAGCTSSSRRCVWCVATPPPERRRRRVLSPARVGLYEFWEVKRGTRQIIGGGADESEIRESAIEETRCARSTKASRRSKSSAALFPWNRSAATPATTSVRRRTTAASLPPPATSGGFFVSPERCACPRYGDVGKENRGEVPVVVDPAGNRERPNAVQSSPRTKDDAIHGVLFAAASPWS